MKKQSKTFLKVGLALASLGTALFCGSVVADMEIDTEGGLTVYDPMNSDYWFRLRGRADLDEIFVTNKHHSRRQEPFLGRQFFRQGRNFQNGGNIRRALLSFSGGVGEDWAYNMTIDFARTAHVRTRGFAARKTLVYGLNYFEDLWVGYSGLWECSRIRFGQFTPIETMDGYGNYMFSNGQMFLEPALATRTFSVPSYINSSSTTMKGFGVILDTEFADMFTLAATVYQPAHGEFNTYNNPTRSDRVGAATRLTFSPLHEDGLVYHFGVLARYQSSNATDRIRPLPGIYNELFFTTPEVVPRNYVGVFESNNAARTGIPVHSTRGTPILVDAGPLRAKSFNHIAGEAAFIFGPTTIQGEYHRVSLQRLPRERQNLPPELLTGRRRHRERGNVDFSGWHVQAGYILTGETRCYDFPRGTLGDVIPCGPYGAWEVVGRYSYVTLIDKEIYGGKEHNVTLGLNWYVNHHIRFMFNYIRANVDPTNPLRAGSRPFFQNQFAYSYVKRKLDIFGLRAQFIF